MSQSRHFVPQLVHFYHPGSEKCVLQTQQKCKNVHFIAVPLPPSRNSGFLLQNEPHTRGSCIIFKCSKESNQDTLERMQFNVCFWAVSPNVLKCIRNGLCIKFEVNPKHFWIFKFLLYLKNKSDREFVKYLMNFRTFSEPLKVFFNVKM